LLLSRERDVGTVGEAQGNMRAQEGERQIGIQWVRQIGI
jgi:hypothetical protein